MIDILLDAVIDTIKLIPFLFIAFLIIEIVENKFEENSEKIIKKSGKLGPLFGSLLGLIPQCGFGVLATNLYVTRIISIGTIVAIYLSTSDEMIPIFLSENVGIIFILKILAIKFIVGMICGFIIDFIYRKDKENHLHDICDDDDCHCEEEGIFIASLKHTLKTLIFLFIFTLIINIFFEYLGEEFLSKLLLKNSLFGPLLSSLIGLIPNCGASIALTKLYLSGSIGYGSLVGGLLSGSGISILLLFKSNKNLKNNLFILGLLYGVGAIVGIIIQLVMLF